MFYSLPPPPPFTLLLEVWVYIGIHSIRAKRPVIIPGVTVSEMVTALSFALVQSQFQRQPQVTLPSKIAHLALLFKIVVYSALFHKNMTFN